MRAAGKMLVDYRKHRVKNAARCLEYRLMVKTMRKYIKYKSILVSSVHGLTRRIFFTFFKLAGINIVGLNFNQNRPSLKFQVISFEELDLVLSRMFYSR